MSKKFSDRVFGQNVSPEVFEIFKKLQDGHLPDPLDQIGDNQGTMAQGGTVVAEKDYLGEEPMFARMWVAVRVEEEVDELNEQGEVDPDKKPEVVKSTIYYVINDNRDKSAASYEPNQSIDSDIFTELTDNPLLKPRAGITSISTKTEGALGSILRTSVEFQVHNKKDFDQIFLPFFLKPGATIVLDYGRSSKNVELYNIEDKILNTDEDLTQLKDELFGTKDENGNIIVRGFVDKNKGKVNVIVGQVTDYNVTVTEQGSFNCSIQLTSANTAVLDKEVTQDNDLKYLFSNQIEELIITILAGDLNDNDFLKYSTFSVEEKRAAKNLLYEKLGLTATIDTSVAKSMKGALISEKSLKSGIFYQDIINKEISFNQSTKNEVLYICLGLFEDIFLNGIISNQLGDQPHKVGFNFRDAVVRWDENLYQRQNQVLGTNEKLPLFLYPKVWRDTYNNKIRGGKKMPLDLYRSQRLLSVEGTQYTNDYKTEVMPLRDLFVSVQLISDMFAKKQNVNDALDGIFERINKDSYGVFKFKMIALNNSFSSISIQDANLIPVNKKEEVLTFDVTSQRSIVKSMDYKLEMPKGGLDTVIAIGNSGTEYTFFDDPAKDNLNFLRMLQKYDSIENKSGRIVDYKSLPITTKDSDEPEEKETKQQKTIRVFEYGEKLTSKGFAVDIVDIGNVATDFQDAVNKIKQKQSEKDKVTAKEYVKRETDNSYDARDNVPCNSYRDYYGKLAQLNTVLGSKDTDVASIMPLKLSLSIFGNSYLQIGDLININFLPQAYRERVYFQILGIEHKIDSDWTTTYDMQMRIRPEGKSRVSKTIKKPVLDEKFSQATSNSDGQEGKSIGSIKESLPMEQGDRTIKASGQIQKREISYLEWEKSKNVKADFEGDRFSYAKMVFSQNPQSIDDLAFLFAFQKTMAQYINKGALTSPNNKPYYRKYSATLNPKYTDVLKPLKSYIPDFYAHILYRDNDSISQQETSVRNFLWPVFKNRLKKKTFAQIQNALLETNKALFGNDKDIKQVFTSNVDDAVKELALPKSLEFEFVDKKSYGENIEVNTKYGTVVKAYAIKIADWQDADKLRSTRDSSLDFLPRNSDNMYEVYAFDMNFSNISTGFIPKIRIPKWFLGDTHYGIFQQTLTKNFYSAVTTIKNILDKK